MRTALALLALGLAAPLAAQSGPAPAERAEGDAIVVTGRAKPPGRAEVFGQARELSRVGDVYEEALARFATPLCPDVVGLRAEAAAPIIARLRINATRLELPLAKGHCTPNLIVAFVDDGRSLLTTLEREQPRMFSLVGETERSELLHEGGPVRVWSYVETRLANGAPVPRFRGREQLPSVRGRAGTSRFFLPTRRDIRAAMVLFERDAVVGMPVEQLADYATMRGLSHTRDAAGDEAMETILSLFADPAAAPAELTGFDLGYLHAIYQWRPDYSAATKFVGIRSLASRADPEKR